MMSTSPAKGYSGSCVEKVAVVIKSDEAEFSPSPCDPKGFSEIIANIPSKEIVMVEGSTTIVDCGFSMELPAGYRCMISSCVPGLILELVDSKRFKVNAINLGGETILHDRETIGRIWVEPVYLPEWINRG
jgi:hypothetical protein